MSETNSNHHLWPGVPFALASAALFGAAPPLAKLLLDSVGPFMLAGLFYLGAGIGLALWRLLQKAGSTRAEEEAPLKSADLPWLAAAIVMGGGVAPVLLMIGLGRTSASSAALLLNMEGLATMAIAWIVFRENVDRRLLLGALAILAGATVISWDGRAVRADDGALYVVGACMAWGIDNNLTRKVSTADPVVITISKGCIAGSVNIGLALSAGSPFPTPFSAAASTIVGFFGIGVSLVLFILSLRHLGTARTGAYFSLAPFIGAVLAIVLLHEPITLRLLLSGCLMGFGLWLHLTERHAHAHRHDEIEHEHGHVHDDHHQHGHSGEISEPHSHAHHHESLTHSHVHYPDIHHRHPH